MSRISAAWSQLTPNARRGVAGGGVIVAAIALVAAVALGGGDGEDTATKPTTTTAPSTTTTAAVTTTTEPPTGPVAPLTGLRVGDPALVNRPPVAVKIDNLDAPSETALPQSGLPKADLVFEEIVEGNITRLVAVFHSQNPGEVGPVRSARTTDVYLLPQLGRPLLAWSGGNQGVVRAVRESPFLVDLGHDAATSSYRREGSRRAPHNLYVQVDELWGRAPGGLPSPPQLFQYRTTGQSNPPTAPQAQGVDITWGGGGASSPVSWRWDGDLRLYVRSQNGRPHLDADGSVITAKNVVVLATSYGQSAADSRSPEALTIGNDEVFAYTNGRVVHGRWDRPALDRPATITDDQGQPILLSPGQTWIELPRPGGATTVN